MRTISIVPGLLALAIANSLAASAQAQNVPEPTDDTPPNALPKINVRARNSDDTRP